MRRALPRVLAAVTGLLLIVMLAALGLAAGAQAQPVSPKPTPTKSSAAPSPTASKTPVLGLTVNDGVGVSVGLGALHIGLKVPVSLPDLLGGRKSTPPTSTRPPASRPTSAPATRTVSHAAPSGTTTPPYPPTSPDTSGSGDGDGTGRPGSGSPSHEPTSERPSTSARPTKEAGGAFVFVKRLVPTNAPAVLVLLCIVCAIGVGVVVKLSGGRRRL